MKKNILGIMGIVGLLFAGCSSEDDILSAFHSDPNAVRITAEVGKASADGFTRSNPLGDADDQKKFNTDDEISVKADGQAAVTYKFNGTEWIPQDDKFLKWESETMNFTAYYPASYAGGTPTQPTEYTSEASLAAADYMSFSNSVNKPTDNNTLTLTMERQMARVVVDIAGFNDQYAGATVNNIKSVSIKGVKAYKHSDKKFYALMVPCDAQSTENFLSLEVGEGNTETLTGIPVLEAGKSYTYQITVGKNKVVVTGITVKDWTTGETFEGKATPIQRQISCNNQNDKKS
uniref:fimbrillin family protein n=1 Tax=Prevotella sp. TaxID=59823 RepID=UPI003FEE2580